MAEKGRLRVGNMVYGVCNESTMIVVGYSVAKEKYVWCCGHLGVWLWGGWKHGGRLQRKCHVVVDD